EAAQFNAQALLAGRLADANSREQAQRLADQPLAAEQARLLAGRQPEPPVSLTRDVASRATRPGSPLWALIEFDDATDEAARAGLEAGLQAAGLLDAWVTPDGSVLDAQTFDALLSPRAPCRSNLGRVLRATSNAAIDAARIEALLAGIACGEDDEGSAEAWFSMRGDYRLGPLAGRWVKPQAEFIGATAREAARLKRLAELAALRAEIEAVLRQLAEERRSLVAAQAAVAEEIARAPGDDALRAAYATYAARKASHDQAQDALAVAAAAFEAARQKLQRAQRELEADASDLKLPADEDALYALGLALQAYRLAIQALLQAQREWLRADHEHAGQQAREASAVQDLASREAECQAKGYAERAARASRDVLRETLGATVEALKAKLSTLVHAVADGETALRTARKTESDSGRKQAVSQQQLADKELRLSERAEARRAAAAQLQGFAETGLLAVALPELEQPATWLVDATLNLARRVEQLLAQVDAEEADWERIRNQVSKDYTELGSALTAQGEQAAMTQSDYGFVVEVRYQNRAERPDTLSLILASEIEQRRGILTAREREVMENHLQAEVAVHLQTLLRAAESQVERINRELHKHPTTTGVRFRLSWEPQPEGTAEAVQGFDSMRKTLINRSIDAWSAEDRQQVGAFLQARTASERTQDRGGTLAEHLAAALDYRRWHRFRVQRQQDGLWKKLSGPASSGERALSLTVPLFAAASSHYESCESPQAPRLVLLDEAFAGIDDEARSHCMALIREFDLDFVMTSEREWGCYATLPGVSICQLLRQEGMDAVFVSRWLWDGRARQALADPARRYPPPVALE
ncbi:MAG: TIGR02680 family protein, partial [Nevskia sp.]|nr:TIGR02680 family protein [Nevskia sp.]